MNKKGNSHEATSGVASKDGSQVALWRHPLASVIVGAIIGMAGTIIVPWLNGNQNAALERAKQRDAALTDMWAVHELPPGTSQEMASAAEAERQIYYLMLASPAAIRATARENAKGLGSCMNDMRPACRDYFVEQVKASRTEMGSGEVSDTDLNMALKPILDQFEASIQVALDNGQISMPALAKGEQQWTRYGDLDDPGTDKLVQTLVTPAFRARFPSTHYGIVLLTGTLGDDKASFCFAEGGVSTLSAGTKTVRVPAYRRLAAHPLESNANAQERVKCEDDATKSVLKYLMAMDPDELAQKSDASL